MAMLGEVAFPGVIENAGVPVAYARAQTYPSKERIA